MTQSAYDMKNSTLEALPPSMLTSLQTFTLIIRRAPAGPYEDLPVSYERMERSQESQFIRSFFFSTHRHSILDLVSLT